MCGWHISGTYAGVKSLWLAHTHDPLFDIRDRLAKAEDQVWGDVPLATYTADVAYLLSLVEP